MKYKDKKVEDIKIAYIGGGSRGWAWGLMSDLAIEPSMSGLVKLYDIDFQAAKDNEIIGNKFNFNKDAVSKWQYKAVATLKEALEGADFVVVSILPGTFDEMESDVHLPEKYKIYQSVGDTVGPGGVIRALRTIPMFFEIANSIKEYAPDAWVINYTNPMTLCVRAMYEVFPEIKAFGCCHEVFGTQKLLAAMAEECLGESNISRQQIKTNVLGINHFTWIDKAYYKNIDLIPLYKEFSEKYYLQGYLKNNDDNWMNNFFISGNRVKFDLFKKFGVIAAAGDRHLAEFVPGSWYLKNPEKANEFMFSLTPVSWRINNQNEKKIKSENIVHDIESIEIKATGEEGINQMKALLGLGDLVTNVNLPNKGQMNNVPIGAVVETNAIFRNNEVSPIISGTLPENVNGLILRHISNQETLIKAVSLNDKSIAFTAFINDPLVNIDFEDAKELFETMIENTKKYLPKEMQ